MRRTRLIAWRHSPASTALISTVCRATRLGMHLRRRPVDACRRNCPMAASGWCRCEPAATVQWTLDLSRPAPAHAKSRSARCAEAYAWLSVATALATMALKSAAWWLTGSVGLLSDALESSVNLAGAVVALTMMHVCRAAARRRARYGYSKAEYFSSGFEGALIFLAAIAIAVAASRNGCSVPRRWRNRHRAGNHAGASRLNLATALVLLRAGRAAPFDRIGGRRPASDDRCVHFCRGRASPCSRSGLPDGNGWIR